MPYHHVTNGGSTNVEKCERSADDRDDTGPIHISATSPRNACTKDLYTMQTDADAHSLLAVVCHGLLSP